MVLIANSLVVLVVKGDDVMIEGSWPLKASFGRSIAWSVCLWGFSGGEGDRGAVAALAEHDGKFRGRSSYHRRDVKRRRACQRTEMRL